MKEIKEQFGTITFAFQAYTEEGMQTELFKRIFEKSEIRLKGLVPVHTHKGGPRDRAFTETYVLKDDGLNHDVRLVTIANGHWEDMSHEDLIRLLLRQSPMVPGVPYNCGEGLAHAIINVAGALEPEDMLPTIASKKFYVDQYHDR